MKNYIVNTTVITYLKDIEETSLLAHAHTIPEVKREFEYLRKESPVPIGELPASSLSLPKTMDPRPLSNVDTLLFQTAKESHAILVTDDKKLQKTAQLEGVAVMDTPRWILALAFSNVIPYEKAEEMLQRLGHVYNRVHSIQRALRHLKEWR